MFNFESLRTLGPDTAHSALRVARAARRLPNSVSSGRLQGLEDSFKVGLVREFNSGLGIPHFMKTVPYKQIQIRKKNQMF